MSTLDGAPAPKKGGKRKGKRLDNRPARKRYWASNVLEFRKIRNMIRYSGMTPTKAMDRWNKTRRRRPRQDLTLSVKQTRTLEVLYEAVRAKRSA